MLFSILYNIARITVKLLIWATAPELISRISAILPARLLTELLIDYGATIGDDVRLTPPIAFHNITEKPPFKNLFIGSHSYLGPQLFLDLKDRVVLGENVTIAMGVMLITHTDLYHSPLKEAGFPSTQAGLMIDDGAYLGARVTVLQGVHIGARSVIAAGALVNKAVPADTIYGGVPAKEIRRIEHV
jgi:acetyltransferase-like isoleucine patch superfamily enzyme